MIAPQTRASLRRVLTVAVLLALPVSLHAQDGSTPLNTGGINTSRSYLSELPFEYVDTLTGSVLLTFTDLRLPGNGGHDLQFVRSFNTGSNTWTFGPAGFPLSIEDCSEDIPTPRQPFDVRCTPVMRTADGAKHGTVYTIGSIGGPNDPHDPATFRHVMTADFWKYDRQTKTLQLPDGTVCVYEDDNQGAVKRLVSVSDPYGTFLEIAWTGDGYWIYQHLSANQTRTLLVTTDGSQPASQALPTSLLYEGDRWLTWTYHYDVPKLLTSVDLPVGPGWTFDYSLYNVTVHTPQGGQVAYVSSAHAYAPDPNDPDTTLHTTFLDSRTISGRNVTTGVWTFDYHLTSAGVSDVTTVTTPSLNRVTFTQSLISSDLAYPAEDKWRLVQRKVEELRGGSYVELEREDLAYATSVSGDDVTENVGPVAVLQTETITRDGHTYQTQLQYNSAHHADFHRPFQTIESGELSRTKTYLFDYSQTPYVMGPPLSESVTVGSQTFSRGWQYESATGFLSSLTAYRQHLGRAITTTLTRDDFGNIASTTDANGHTITLDHQWGVVSNAASPEYAIARGINQDGTIASETRHGATTNLSYDMLSRLILQTPPEGNATVTDYDNDGGASYSTFRGPTYVTTFLDGLGRGTGTLNSVGTKTSVDYDAEGRTSFKSLPYTGSARVGDQLTYDALGRLTRTTHSDQTFSTYAYSGSDVTVTDEKGHQTVQHWQAFGTPDDRRLQSVVDANQQTWAYEYNALGKLTRITAPDGLTRTWTYDLTNLLTTDVQPETGTKQYTEYDNAGLLKKMVDAKGVEHRYSYDGNDRITQVAAGTKTTTITYAPGSENRSAVAVQDGTTVTTENFTYDTAERLRSIEDIINGHSLVTQYDPDDNGNVSTLTYPSGRVIHYGYDSANRVTSVHDDAQPAFTDYANNFTYHPSGALLSFTMGNGITQHFDYHPTRYWPTSIQAGDLSLQYQGYDAVGQVGTITDSRSGFTQTFGYDALDRLTSATGVYGTTSYLYDVHGNRVTAGGTSYSYYPNTLRVATQDNLSFTYDANGNLTGQAGNTYGYDAENMLTSASTNNGSRQSRYVYGGDGLRAFRSVATSSGTTTSYFVHGPFGLLLSELTDNAGTLNVVRDYIYAGTRLVASVVPPPHTTPTSIQIKLTHPVDGDGFRGAPANITITAEASDSNSTIAQVDFYSCVDFDHCNDVIATLTTPTTAPSTYTTVWSNVPAGTYRIRAKATSAAGQTAMSKEMATVVVKPIGLLTSLIITPLDDIPQFQAVSITVDGTNPCGAILTDYGDGTAYVHPIVQLPVTFTYAWQTQGPKTVTVTAEGNCDGSLSRNITVGPPNAQPTVQLTAPANGASFPANVPITLTATASDADGTIAHVDFYANDTQIGQPVTSAPYSVTWTPTAPGNYALSARATDNRSGSATSNAVTVSVGNLSSITVNPSTVITGQTVTVTVTGLNPCGAVDIDYGDGFHQTSAITGLPVTVPLELPYHSWATAGLKTVTATGFGNCAGTIQTTVQVNGNVPPSVTLTSPAAGARYTAPATIALSATASDSDGSIARVEFYADATLIGTATGSPYTVTWSNVGAGSYTLTAKAFDNGNASTTSAAVPITVTEVGAVVITPSTVVTGQTAQVTVNGAGTCGSVTIDYGDGTVITYANGGLPMTQPHAWATTGTKTVTATGQGNCLGSASGTVTVNADTPPVVALTAPANGSTFVVPTNITVSATASDSDGIQRVEFYAGSTLFATTTSSPYSVTLPAAANQTGNYTITAKAYDNFGASTVSAARTITLTEISGVSVSPSPVGQQRTANITVTGSSACGSIAIDHGDGTTPIVYALSGLPTTQTYAWATPGDKLVTVTGQGNCVGTASVQIHVNANMAPSVTLTGPASGSSYFAPASIPLSATASDTDGTINRVEFWTTAGTPIATLTSPPYNVTWTGVGIGTYTLFARAYDDLGAHTDSAGSTVTVNNPGQVTGISVSSPRTLGQASTATVTGTNPCGAVTINWGDGTAAVTYPITGLPTTQSHVWAASGTRTVAVNGEGNCAGSSSSTTISVNAPPTVSITGPINGSTFVAPASFDITANASDPDSGVQRVDFYANGTFLGSDTTAPYSFSWANVGAGTYGLQAVAVDNLGVSTTSATVSVTVNNAGPSQVTSIQLVPSQPVIGTNTTVNVFGTNPCGAVQIDYGDGTVITYPITGLSFSQVHVWNSPGAITVTATGMGNCSGQVSKTTSVVP